MNTNRSARGLITAYLLITMLLLAAMFALQGALLDTIIDSYALEASQSGLPNAAAFICGIAALISAFFMLGRRTKRTLLRISTLICVMGLLLLYFASNFALFVAAWGVLGFGLGLMDSVLSACMADLYEGHTATIMMCMLHTAFGIGSMLSPIAYARLLSGGTHWKEIYLITGIVGAIIAACGFIGRAALQKKGVTEPMDQPQSMAGLFKLIRTENLILPMLAMFFHGIFLSGLNTWINRYAATIGGGDGLPAMSFMFFGVLISRATMSFLPVRTDRFVKYAGFISGAVLLIGILTYNPLVLKISVAISGLIFGALIPFILSLACGHMHDNTLLVTTSLMLALYIGQGISSPIIGAIEAAAGLQYGIMLCAACMALCSLCCLVNRRQ